MKPLRILNILALVVTLIMNGLSQAPGLFPRTVGELGESRAIFFLPAGYVFSIWGIIYLGLIAYVIFQARAKDAALDQAVGPWFILSCIGNSTWLLLFLADQLWLSTLAMLLILISLVTIYQRLGIGVRAVSRARLWAVHIPFSIYLGWITVATIANFAAALYVSGQVTSFVGITADVWAAVMMVVALVLTALLLWYRRDIAFAAVVVWALVGIYARPFTTEVFEVLSSQNIALVDNTALVLAVGVVVIGVVVLFVRPNRNADSIGGA